MPKIDSVGWRWLAEEVAAMQDHIERVGPVECNEAHRYLSQSRRPGFIRYDLFPFLREIIECFSIYSDVREANMMKGVQVGYTTLLESVLFYYIIQIKTMSAMFITADKELATRRMENDIIPMINESGFADRIRSSDVGNSRKTGKNKDFIQFEGGCVLYPLGAVNAKKMRMTPVPLMLKDELDGWARAVGDDGDPDALTDARLSTYWDVRKILRGSTPLLKPSMINDAYKRGDQRKYMVLCKACSFPQALRWEKIDKESGTVRGFLWETTDGVLDLDSVRYACLDCGHEHFEVDKTRLFAEEHGAHWKPTATPIEEGIRSYHLPAFYSPFGFRPWSKNVSDYLASFDPATKQVTNVAKYQEFYNNTLGMPFTPLGARVRLSSVSAHSRPGYRYGEIPNKYADTFSGSPVLFLLCLVDVHKDNLAVSVMGWTKGSRCYVIDYWRFRVTSEEEDCGEIGSPAWGRLRELIEEAKYVADDGQEYSIAMTLIDAGYANDTVSTFCSDYSAGVYPILGRDRPAKNQAIREFAEFTTQAGTVGFRILVDHYKDRLAPVLRREWVEEAGMQKLHHFNAPVDITTKQLTELTVERREKKTDEKGHVSYIWYRPGNAPNELWDLLGYGSAGVEIMAWLICIQHFEMEAIEWDTFWEFAAAEEYAPLFGRTGRKE